MEKDNKVVKIIKELGFNPKEGKAIMVKFGGKNLSATVLDFFIPEFFIMQICDNEIIFLPVEYFTSKVKVQDQVHLEIPFNTINSVKVEENLLNYDITIETDTDIIELSAQQKELSGIRSSGVLSSSTYSIFGNENWHKINFDDTLKELLNLNKNS